MKRKHEKDTEGEGSREISTRLTKIEEDLLSHLQAGYQLETDSLGADPLLRRLKDNEVIRPQSVTLNTYTVGLRQAWRCNYSASRYERRKGVWRNSPGESIIYRIFWIDSDQTASVV